MTTKLAEAVALLEELPADIQDQMAESLLADLAWERSLRNHPEVLQRLADEAEADIRAGRTHPLNANEI